MKAQVAPTVTAYRDETESDLNVNENIFHVNMFKSVFSSRG